MARIDAVSTDVAFAASKMAPFWPDGIA